MQWKPPELSLIRDRISLDMASVQEILDKVLIFLLRDVARYRFKVIRENLKSSFEYGSDTELNSDIDLNYLYLSRLIREIVWVPSLKNFDKFLSVKPYDQIYKWLSGGKSVIVVMGHLGNWEWAGLYLSLLYPGQVCILYRKLKSGLVNRWMFKHRSRLQGEMINAARPGDLIRLIRQKPWLVVMIADQNPGNDQGILWTDFFQKRTAFANGPETLARKYQLPVVYLKNHPLHGHGYELEFEIIWDGNETLPEGEITRRYALALENNIRMHKHQWLWSHKRWKRSGMHYR